MGKRLLTLVQPEDTVARFGGDEFVLLLQAISSRRDKAVERAGLASRKILSAVRDPIIIEGVTCNCSASIGVTLFGVDAITPDELLKQADLAMLFADLAHHKDS